MKPKVELLPIPSRQWRLGNLAYRIHDLRANRRAPLQELRAKHIRAATAEQARAEAAQIEQWLAKMPDSHRRRFLQARLRQIMPLE